LEIAQRITIQKFIRRVSKRREKTVGGNRGVSIPAKNRRKRAQFIPREKPELGAIKAKNLQTLKGRGSSKGATSGLTIGLLQKN